MSDSIKAWKDYLAEGNREKAHREFYMGILIGAFIICVALVAWGFHVAAQALGLGG